MIFIQRILLECINRGWSFRYDTDYKWLRIRYVVGDDFDDLFYCISDAYPAYVEFKELIGMVDNDAAMSEVKDYLTKPPF